MKIVLFVLALSSVCFAQESAPANTAAAVDSPAVAPVAKKKAKKHHHKAKKTAAPATTNAASK